MNRGLSLVVALAAFGLALAGCSKGNPGGGAAYPPTEAGAQALLSQFLKPGADAVALAKQLQPRPEDYRAVFASEELAKKAEEAYGPLWSSIERNRIGPKPGQTELKLWAATSDDLKAGAGNADKFPGGYARVAAHFKPGLTVYRWKFVKPGETLGMAYDGLWQVGGRWVWMPKPWRIAK